MKKIIIAVAVLAVLGGGSLGAYFAVKSSQDEKQHIESELANENVLFNFNSDDVTEVDFDCPDGEFIAVLNNGNWQFSNTDEISPNQEYITNVVTYMCDLSAEKNFGKAEDADLAKYGLDSPITITCRTPEKDYTIYMGNPTPTNEAFYCMAEGKDKIYSIDYSYGSVLYANKELLKTKYLTGYSDSEITGFELIRNGESIYKTSLDSDNIWHFDGEYSYLQLDSTKISSMISVLTRLKAEKFIESNLTDYSKYGFDKPYAQMKISGTDGKTHSLLFSKYGDDPNYIYILIEESGQVSTYYTSDVYYIENTVNDVAVTQIYSTYMSTVNTLDINYKGEEIHFELDSENSKYKVNGEDISDYGEEVLTNLYTMYNALSNIGFSGIEKDAKVSGEPEITVEYHLDDDINTVMEFIPKDETSYYLKINGEYTGFTISKPAVEGDYSFIYWYRKLMTAIEEYKL
ncbi:MAG: DUF4340 domain-containing protein [Oscillospiraceae bacterium]|nr:DUF4340 domain-containing protein [Oscillospiraceae bacterium]